MLKLVAQKLEFYVKLFLVIIDSNVHFEVYKTSKQICLLFNDKIKGLMAIPEHPAALSTETEIFEYLFQKKHFAIQVQASQTFQ